MNNKEEEKYYIYLYEQMPTSRRLILGMTETVRAAIINNMVGNYWCDDMLEPAESTFYSAPTLRIVIKRGFRLI